MFLRWRLPRGGYLLPALSYGLAAFSAVLLSSFGAPRGVLLETSFVNGVAAASVALLAGALIVRLEMLEEFRYLLIVTALILAGALVCFGTGPVGTDTRINLFGVFQPAEPIKLLVVLFLASYFANRDIELRQLDAVRWMGLSFPRWRDALPVTVVLAATLVLFFLQKDLGPALVMYLVFLGLFVAASRRVALGLTGLLALLATFWGAYRFRLLATVSTRIEMWLSPWDNHRPGGVQLAESLWALASGGFWGSGIGRADAHYIPAGHTDLILAAAGETFGVPGIALLLAICACLVLAMTLAWWRARSTYARYLGLGLTLLLGVQAFLIMAGSVGLVPLTGVPLPFVSYGKSALVTDFFALGLLLNLSPDPAAKAPSRGPGRWSLLMPLLIVIGFGVVGWRTCRVMTSDADTVLVRGSLTPQADGVRRFSYNRRILDIANRIPRGTVRDAHRLALATSRPDDLVAAADALKATGVQAEMKPTQSNRVYPFGRYAAHVVGHGSAYWADAHTIERSYASVLRGYPYQEQVVESDGHKIVRRDYAGLVTAFRGRFDGLGGPLERLLKIDRDVRTTLDARLQIAAMRALERNLPVVGGVRRTRAAAVILDAASGGILTSVSLPTYDPNAVGEEIDAMFDPAVKAALDRARFEIYPPGSTFKLVAACAALDAGIMNRPDTEREHTCHHTDEISWSIRRQEHRRRVSDDEAESAHGRIGLRQALVESCNVYFAWLGTQLGPAALFNTATQRLHLALKGIADETAFNEFLPDHAYGQAKVTVSVLENASVAAMIANGGMRIVPSLGVPTGLSKDYISVPSVNRERALNESTAATVRGWMVDVVMSGTGRRAAVKGLIVGGKTGTAQTDSGDRLSHAWFVGFAYPESATPEHAIAFAFLIENGGYGGRAAAQAAHDFLVEWAAIQRSGES